MGSVRFQERKIGDEYCLRLPAFVLRPPRLRHSPSVRGCDMATTNDLTPCRMPCVLSSPTLSLRLRQNTRPYGYAGVVVHRSALSRYASCTPSLQFIQLVADISLVHAAIEGLLLRRLDFFLQLRQAHLGFLLIGG